MRFDSDSSYSREPSPAARAVGEQPRPAQPDGEAGRKWISAVLKAGSYGSAVLMFVGLLLAFFRPPAAAHYALGEMFHRAARLDPTAVMQAGIALLLITPVLRILTALVSFLREGDYRYACISAGVFLIVIGSILLGVAH